MPAGRKPKLELNIKLQPKQWELFECIRQGDFRYPFYGGAKGGGKSYASRAIMLLMLMANPGTAGMLLRRKYTEVMGNHIRPLLMQYPKFGDWFNKTEKVLTLPNGSILAFGHSDNEDDIMQYQGQEFDYIAVEEVTNFTEFQWDILTQSNRTAKPGIRPVMWATGNPGGVGHLWVKRLWIDRRHEELENPDDYYFIPAKVKDNQILMSVDPNYIKVLQRMKDEHLRRAYLEGDWDIFPGQFFGNFNRSKHVIKSFPIPEGWTLTGSIDHGTTAPTSFGLYATDYNKKVYRVTEYYAAGRSAEENAKEIKRRIAGCPHTRGRMPDIIYADPSMWAKVRLNEDHAEAPVDKYAEQGLFLTKANNDRVNGWGICNDALVHDQFYLFDGWNTQWLRTVPALPRSDKNVEDLDTHAEDHAADDWRYAMVHIYQPMEVEPPQKFPFNSGSRIMSELEQMRKEPEDVISMLTAA